LIRAQRDHLALAALPLTVSVEVDGLARSCSATPPPATIYSGVT
jgi:hypothetical protein